MHRIHSQFQQEAERRANNAIIWRGATFLFVVIALFAVAAAWPNPPSIKQLGAQCALETTPTHQSPACDELWARKHPR